MAKKNIFLRSCAIALLHHPLALISTGWRDGPFVIFKNQPEEVPVSYLHIY